MRHKVMMTLDLVVSMTFLSSPLGDQDKVRIAISNFAA